MQKNKVIEAYKKKECVNSFDSTRSSTYGQKWHNDYEKDLVIDSINNLGRNNIKILDVACGTGRFVQDILKMNRKIEYHGLDTSKEMLKKLKKRLGNKFVNLYNADASNMPFKDNTFDITYSFHLLWHLEKKDQVEMIREMIRVTKNGGIIVIDAYNRDFLYNNLRKKTYKRGYEIFRLSVNEMKKILKSLKDIEVFGILDPHINNKFIFHAMTFLPNKVFRKMHFLHHMLYFKIKTTKMGIKK